MRALHRLALACLFCAGAFAAPNPLVVLREAYGHDRAAIEQAAAEAPDEAVAVMSRGPSVLFETLESSSNAALRVLPALARDRCVPEVVCSAAAVFYRQIASGAITAAGAKAAAANRSAYFHRLVTLRLHGPDALFDRVLHQQAEDIRSAWMEGGEGRRSLAIGRFPPRDLYAILAYGQREESEVSFARFFDAEFAPRMSGARLLSALSDAHSLRLRNFLVEAIRANRVRELLDVAAGERSRLVALSLHGIASEQEGALAAEVLEAYGELVSPGAVEAALLDLARSNEPAAGLLAAWLDRVRGGLVDKNLSALAKRYATDLPVADRLQSGDVCAGGVCTQRLIFFDDDDGAASFATFQAQYRKDPAWTWEDHHSYVRAWRKGAAGLTVEVFANRPQPSGGAVSMAWQGGEARARDALAQVLNGRGAPRIFVQRGHAYHVAKAIQMIPSEARLVYLGGCRGTENLAGVLDRAPQAQVVATRSTGTMDVNDPLLKSINDELADHGRIQWTSFWDRQRSSFARSRLFARYIPPNRNGAVIFMQAWRRLAP